MIADLEKSASNINITKPPALKDYLPHIYCTANEVPTATTSTGLTHFPNESTFVPPAPDTVIPISLEQHIQYINNCKKQGETNLEK